MHVRHFEIFFQTWNLTWKITQADLKIKKNNAIYFRRKFDCFINLAVRHTQTIFTIFTGRTLCGYGNIMNRWNGGSFRICSLPFVCFGLELLQHYIWCIFAEHAHSGRVEIAVIGNDSIEGKKRATEWIFAFYRPFMMNDWCGRRSGRNDGIVCQHFHFQVVKRFVEDGLWFLLYLFYNR